MQVDTPVKNTLTALAMLPVLFYLAVKKLLTLAFAAVVFVVVFVGTMALLFGLPVAVFTAAATVVTVAVNYALYVAFGVAMLSAVKSVAIGFLAAVALRLIKGSR